jgi:hypothetical protein
MKKKTKAKGRRSMKVAPPAEALVAAVADEVAAPPPTKRKRQATRRSVRYTGEQQDAILSFVREYQEKNGRGAQAAAVKKFGVSAITLSKWLKASGKPGKTAGKRGGKLKASAASAPARKVVDVDGALLRMIEIRERISALNAEFAALRGNL